MAEKRKYVKIILAIILLLYPCRHFFFGVDLWDAGYNCANFVFFNQDSIGETWYYSTYLSNAIGAFLIRMSPDARLMVMNLFTSLIEGGAALISFFFLTKKIFGGNEICVFVGEIIALSLVFLPSTILYTHLSNVFFMAAIVLLMLGLMEDKRGYLILAGAVLGLNVGNRFSNIIQILLIVVLWFNLGVCKKPFKEIVLKTSLCVAGFAAAFGILLLIIGISSKDMTAYFKGVFGLMGMSKNASDYSAQGMIKNFLSIFTENIYWTKRFLLMLFAGLLVAIIPVKVDGKKKVIADGIKRIICVLICIAVLIYMQKYNFAILSFRSYYSILAPFAMFMQISLVLYIVVLLNKRVDIGLRTMALVSIIVFIVTNFGSNNGILGSANGLYLLMPYTLGIILLFIKNGLFENQIKDIRLFPLKSVVCTGALVVMILSFLFGIFYINEEAAGAEAGTVRISGIRVLNGMRTDGEKSKALTDIAAYIMENDFSGYEVILRGEIPGLAYFLNLKPALHAWSDLRSYTPYELKEDLEIIKELPIIITTVSYADNEIYSFEASKYEDFTAEKIEMINDFISRHNYEEAYRNAQFCVFVAR